MKHILVVDDSPTIRKAIRRILEQLGHVVEEVGDGQEAITRLEGGGHFDAILCDIDMPVMDGLAFLGELPKHPRISAPPIIMCTTHTSFDKISLALTAKERAVCALPSATARMRSHVRLAFCKRATLSA